MAERLACRAVRLYELAGSCAAPGMRAALEFTHGNITRSQYWCSYIANTVYAGFLCCFPMLLVLTPDLSSGIRDIHTYVT